MIQDQYKQTFAKNLKHYMGINNKDQIDLINDLGFNKSSVSSWCNGTRLPRMDKVDALAKYFHINRSDLIEDKSSTDDIYTYDNIYPIELKRFPLLGEIACGEPIFCNEDRESYILAGTDIKADFCLKAHGDSMVNARIYDGDIVFIKEQPLVNDGEIAAVIIENEATLKRVYFDRNNNTLQLVAENPAYRPMVYVGESLNSIRILGKAVAFQSDVK
ncbi:hypothetical protein GCM10008922_10710 [Faecalicatena contorta]|uniref:LexA family protein n=1 Tax=Faecalicatena contorta TaxID=39482 RepID=UPI0031DFB718